MLTGTIIYPSSALWWTHTHSLSVADASCSWDATKHFTHYSHLFTWKERWIPYTPSSEINNTGSGSLVTDTTSIVSDASCFTKTISQRKRSQKWSTSLWRKSCWVCVLTSGCWGWTWGILLWKRFCLTCRPSISRTWPSKVLLMERGEDVVDWMMTCDDVSQLPGMAMPTLSGDFRSVFANVEWRHHHDVSVTFMCTRSDVLTKPPDIKRCQDYTAVVRRLQNCQKISNIKLYQFDLIWLSDLRWHRICHVWRWRHVSFPALEVMHMEFFSGRDKSQVSMGRTQHAKMDIRSCVISVHVT